MYRIVVAIDYDVKLMIYGKLINIIVQDDPKVGDKVTLIDLMNPDDVHDICYHPYDGHQGSKNKICHWKYYKYICTI